MNAYNLNKMSGDCKVLYERGRFFIETGTARSFSTWAKQNDKIRKYVPRALLLKVSNFINGNDKDAAVALWFRICKLVDDAPLKITKSITLNILKLVIAGMAIYAFFSVLLA